MLKGFSASTGARRFGAAAVLILSMLTVYLFMAASFQQSLLSAVNDQNAQFSDQVNTISASLQNMIQAYATQIFHASSVRHVRTSKEHTNFEMIEAMREITKYEALCPFIDSIYLYNGKRGYIYYAGNSFAHGSDYIHKFKDESAVSLLLNMTPDKKLVPIYRCNGSYSPYSQNNYVYSYLMFDVEKGAAGDNALMINIPAKWLNNFLFGDSNPAQWVIGKDGGIIASPQMEAAPTEKQQDALNQVRELARSEAANGYLAQGKGAQRMLYFYAQMGSTGWIYVRSLPYEACMGPMLKVQRLVWTVFSMILFALTVLAVLISVKVLSPYRRLVTGISQIEGVEQSEGDASKMLEQLTTLAGRSRDMERLNASFREMLREETVRNILFGSQSQPFDAELARQYGMNLEPDRPLFLMLVSSIRLGRYLEYVRLLTPNAEGAVISAEYAVLLIQADASLQAAISRSVSECAPTRRVMYTPMCLNWNDIPAYYDMLLETYRRRFLYDEMILPCESILRNLNDQREPLENTIQNILQALRRCSLTDAEAQYGDLVACLREKRLQTVFVTLSHLFTDAAQILYRLNPDALPDQPDRRAQFDALLTAPETMEEIHRCFTGLFREIIDCGSLRQKEKRSTLITRMLSRIDEQLSNPALNSQSLADEFSFSSAYLCRVFRQETGVSLADYINAKRIERARALLADPNLLVKDIALKTGFSTEKYFYVVFRKITGVTPRQYRDAL